MGGVLVATGRSCVDTMGCLLIQGGSSRTKAGRTFACTLPEENQPGRVSGIWRPAESQTAKPAISLCSLTELRVLTMQTVAAHRLCCSPHVMQQSQKRRRWALQGNAWVAAARSHFDRFPTGVICGLPRARCAPSSAGYRKDAPAIPPTPFRRAPSTPPPPTPRAVSLQAACACSNAWRPTVSCPSACQPRARARGGQGGRALCVPQRVRQVAPQPTHPRHAGVCWRGEPACAKRTCAVVACWPAVGSGAGKQPNPLQPSLSYFAAAGTATHSFGPVC